MLLPPTRTFRQEQRSLVQDTVPKTICWFLQLSDDFGACLADNNKDAPTGVVDFSWISELQKLVGIQKICESKDKQLKVPSDAAP